MHKVIGIYGMMDTKVPNSLYRERIHFDSYRSKLLANY
jgi:hypothetical protein